VIKNDKEHHKLKFNKNYDNPLLLNEGWESFKKFHNLPDDVEVVLQYTLVMICLESSLSNNWEMKLQFRHFIAGV
jgi:hypothetical protein